MKNKKMLLIIFVSALFLCSNITGASKNISKELIEKNFENSNNNPQAEWSFLVYLDADNNLEYFGIDDFLEMATIGSTSKVNIVVQFDRIPSYDTRYDDWTSTKRYLVTKNMVPDISNAIMDIGEANMGDPTTLINFVNWAKNNYPANNYCLVLWDHGSGWRNQGKEVVKSVCDDYTSGDTLELSELKNALSQITSGGSDKIELIGFDACLMQMIEVAYELFDYCDYMTGSEEVEPAAGWVYDDIFSSLINNPTMSPETLGGVIVNSYDSYTLSTLNLDFLEDVADEVSDLGSILQDDSFKSNIQKAIRDVETYQDYDFVDLYHFADLLQFYINDGEVDSKTQTIMNKINNLVTSEKHTANYQNSHGISIYVPYNTYNEDYEYIDFSQDTYWDEFLDWYHNGHNSDPPTEPVITGPNSGFVGELYEYAFYSLDPEGDYLSYYVEWGDFTPGEWIGPVQSGVTGYASHSWAYSGAFIIKAKAVDEHGSESQWSYHTVTIPKNRVKNNYNNIIYKIFDNFPNLKILFSEVLFNE
jgi:hypothetical protein